MLELISNVKCHRIPVLKVTISKQERIIIIIRLKDCLKILNLVQIFYLYFKI